jgi:hypothetical protein
MGLYWIVVLSSASARNGWAKIIMRDRQWHGAGCVGLPLVTGYVSGKEVSPSLLSCALMQAFMVFQIPFHGPSQTLSQAHLW